MLLAIEFCLWPHRDSHSILKVRAPGPPCALTQTVNTPPTTCVAQAINKSCGYITEKSRARAADAVTRFLSRPKLPSNAGLFSKRGSNGTTVKQIPVTSTAATLHPAAPPLSARTSKPDPEAAAIAVGSGVGGGRGTVV